MELRVITQPDLMANEASIINELFTEGLTTLHLRKPKWTNDQLLAMLGDIHEHFHERLVLHQMHHLAKEYGVKGVHLKSTERAAKNEEQLEEWIDEYKERGCKISTAIHSLPEIDELEDRFDLLTVSPIFESISKPGYRSEIDWLTILKERDLSKLMAIGGINGENIEKLFNIKFSACGAMGVIWEEGNPVYNFKIMQDICARLVHSS